jgi:hypothetical protein
MDSLSDEIGAVGHDLEMEMAVLLRFHGQNPEMIVFVRGASRKLVS